jgi:hypothetical protein
MEREINNVVSSHVNNKLGTGKYVSKLGTKVHISY